MTPAAPAPAAATAASTWLARSFVFSVAAFAWWRFSDNVADNDLWGHVLYGQRMLRLGGLETTETLSWTAAGAPWINHEVLAELALGGVHLLAGGTGLWLLMLALAGATLLGAWRLGAGGTPGQRLVAVAWLALLTNPIALGYAVRPQLFTYFFFVVLLAGLRSLFQGRRTALLFLPALLALWANTHGGFFAGWVVLLVAVGTELLLATQSSLAPRLGFAITPAPRPLLLGAASLGTAALVANPWGWQLVIWTFETLRLPRPDLFEWHAMPLAWSSVPFFAAVFVGALGWGFTRRPLAGWEIVVWALLAFMALRHQRHAPLFGLASLAFLPMHLADVAARLAPSVAGLRATLRRPVIACVVAGGCVVLALASLTASVGSARAPLFRMVVPRGLYPVAAIEFMRARELTGNTLTFFDWGQQVLWELPRNPVSFDGRLDTVYSPPIMDAHWELYAGRDPGAGLDLGRAEVALLPRGSPAVRVLARHGWREIYTDPLAAVLVRTGPPRSPVLAGSEAVSGAVAFPDQPAALAQLP